MNATVIAQAYLDEVALAVMADNWDAYRHCISSPFLMINHTGTMHFATPEDLRSLYTEFLGMLRTQRVTDYIRLVEDAELIDRDLITARYVTHLLSGGNRIMDPVRSSISLRFEDGRWRAASITNALSNSRWPSLLPRLGEDPL